MRPSNLACAALAALFLVPGCAGEPEQPPTTGQIASALGTHADIEIAVDPDYHRLVVESYFTGSDGEPIRFKLYQRLGRTRAFVVFVNGRSEFMEKYDVLFTSLHEFPVGDAPEDETLADLPLSFASLDHAGQGMSIGTRTRGHIDDFDTFVSDLETLVQAIRYLDPFDRPIYLASHSMGGLVSVRFAQKRPDLVDGLILGSPLLKLRPVPGLPEAGLRFVAQFYSELVGMPKLCTSPPGVDQETVIGVALCAGGLLEDQLPGCQACFNTPDGCGVPEVQGLKAAFAYLQSIGDQGCPDPTFQCPAPYLSTDDAYCDYAQTHPLAGPEATFGWLNAAFAALDGFNAEPVAAPTIILSNPNDVVVDPTGHSCDNFAGPCEVVAFPYGHEMFTAAERAETIAQTRAFLGY